MMMLNATAALLRGTGRFVVVTKQHQKCFQKTITTTASSSSSSLLCSISQSNTPFHRQQQCRQVHIEKRLQDLGLELPAAPIPKANYNIVCCVPGSGDTDTLYVSGHLPVKKNGALITGAIGPADPNGESIEHGYNAAHHCGLNILSTLQKYLDGDLDRVTQVIKMFGIVQSTTCFKEQHLVMDGCSDVIMKVFEKPIGYHARSAIGTSTLPLNMSVEVEAIVQIKRK